MRKYSQENNIDAEPEEHALIYHRNICSTCSLLELADRFKATDKWTYVMSVSMGHESQFIIICRMSCTSNFSHVENIDVEAFARFIRYVVSSWCSRSYYFSDTKAPHPHCKQTSCKAIAPNIIFVLEIIYAHLVFDVKIIFQFEFKSSHISLRARMKIKWNWKCTKHKLMNYSMNGADAIWASICKKNGEL